MSFSLSFRISKFMLSSLISVRNLSALRAATSIVLLAKANRRWRELINGDLSGQHVWTFLCNRDFSIESNALLPPSPLHSGVELY